MADQDNGYEQLFILEVVSLKYSFQAGHLLAVRRRPAGRVRRASPRKRPNTIVYNKCSGPLLVTQKIDNHVHRVALYTFWYNCRINSSVRMSPAMALIWQNGFGTSAIWTGPEGVPVNKLPAESVGSGDRFDEVRFGSKRSFAHDPPNVRFAPEAT
jgi:hypothetical protein